MSEPKLSRRLVFAGAGTAGALAVAAAVLPRQVAQAELAAAKSEPTKGRGYQLTAHVQRYYETTKV